AICVPERELRRALSGSGGLHTILDVVLAGQKTTHPSILKEYQQDKLRGWVIHIDLQEVRLDQPIQASVTVQLMGGEDAPGGRGGRGGARGRRGGSRRAGRRRRGFLRHHRGVTQWPSGARPPASGPRSRCALRRPQSRPGYAARALPASLHRLVLATQRLGNTPRRATDAAVAAPRGQIG